MNFKCKLTKQKIVSLAIVIALFAIAAMGTFAYFTDTATAHNVISSGKMDITLNNKTIRSGVLVDFPKEGILDVLPGRSVDKIVSVTNNSAGDSYIRVVLDVSVTGADGKKLPLIFTDKQGNERSALSINFTESPQWMEGTDGNYYCKAPVKSGETTENLFESVTFPFELPNDYQNSKVEILVTAEAVQAVNNPIPESGTVENVPGWPESAP